MQDHLTGYLGSLDQEGSQYLHQNSFVDSARRLIYVATPKVACTTFKTAFFNAQAGGKPPAFAPASPETRRSMFVHAREQLALPSLASLHRSGKLPELDLAHFFNFALVRHPVVRLFSAWRDKVFLVEPGYERLMTLADAHCQFVEWHKFARQVLDHEDLDRCDVHWRRQTRLLEVLKFIPARIYRLDGIRALEADLQRHLADLGHAETLALPARQNEGFQLQPADFIAAGLAREIEAAYACDMQAFRFAPTSGLAELAPLRAADIASPFTDAIFERNRVISLHVQSRRALALHRPAA